MAKFPVSGGCTAFGTLIAATDPVAVIALFKELCVPEGLTMLVEGESMLNDATAIVLFELVMAVVASEGVEAVTALERAPLNVFAVLGGGVLTGGIIAAVMEDCAALAKKDYLIQATVSVIIAYAAFLVAEHYLHVSGLIAVLTAGLVVGALATFASLGKSGRICTTSGIMPPLSPIV